MARTIDWTTYKLRPTDTVLVEACRKCGRQGRAEWAGTETRWVHNETILDEGSKDRPVVKRLVDVCVEEHAEPMRAAR